MIMTNRSPWIFFDLGAPAPPQHGFMPVNLLLLLLSAAATAAAAAVPSTVPEMTTDTSSSSSSLDYPSLKFDPSIAIVVAVLLCAFVLLGFCSLFVRQCAGITADRGNSPYYAAGMRLSVRGLDPKVINSFPIFNYAEIKDLKIGKGSLECAVCINEFEDDETLRLLPKCDHVFHPECIDAWLAFHTTCPICRANLKSTPDEHASDTAQVTESDDSATEEHNIGSEIDGVQIENDNQNQIAINVDEDQNRDTQPQVSGTLNCNQRRVAKFPRSQSTGHSLLLPGESCERYTLRLSEAARLQIISQRLKRTRSLWGINFPTTEESSRRGYRSGDEGSSRGRQVGRWVRAMTPPFSSRTGSIMSPKVGVNGDVTSVGTFNGEVLTPFSCLAGKNDGVGNSSNHPLL